jgi:LPS export ABC transporter protein LptC
MQIQKHINKSVMALLVAITLFACEGNLKNVQRLNLADNAPVTEGKGINFKYTDSGRVVYNVLATKFLDYSNFEFGYEEFPDGIEVNFYDEDNKKNTVVADYAINYTDTEIVDLRNNVVLITSDRMVLKAQQLYWDKENKWVFTDQPYQIKLKNGTINNGAMFDSSQDFTNFLSRKNKGVQIIDKKDKL